MSVIGYKFYQGCTKFLIPTPPPPEGGWGVYQTLWGEYQIGRREGKGEGKRERKKGKGKVDGKREGQEMGKGREIGLGKNIKLVEGKGKEKR